MAEIDIYPSDDSYVDANAPDTNYGTETDLFIQAVSYSKYIFLKFSLSAIPSGSTINSAILYLYMYYAEGTVIGNTYLCDTDWAEGTIKWSNKPSGTGGDLKTWTFNSTGWKNSGNVFATIVSDWNSGAINNYGLVISTTTAGNPISKAYSKDNATNKPYMKVDYTPPPTSGFMIFLSEAFNKGKKYFKKKGLYLPDNKLYKPEILIPEGI